MKTIKSTTIGIIIGVTATLSITALAEYIISPNPFPVKVNGVETSIQGYNINDSTFFKLRDIADAVGGFSVDFKDNAIMLDTQAAAEVTPTPMPTVKAGLAPLPELPVERRDGKEYVSKYKINDMLKNIGLGQYQIAGHEFFNKNDSDPWNSILTNIPLYEHGIELIPLDYYTSTIVPIINSLR